MLDCFSKNFSNHLPQMIICSFPVIFTYKRFNFCYSLISSWFNATVTVYWKLLLFSFLSIKRIHHLWNLFYGIYCICFIINRDLCIINFRMYYTLVIIIFKKIKINCYYYFNFHPARSFETIYDIFWVWSNFIKIFFNW